MSRTRRWIAIFAGGLMLVVALVCGSVLWLVVAARQVPQFYSQALEIKPEQARTEGAKFERGMLELHNEVRNADQFSISFTAEEINGWLAGELPRKFPKALPAEVRDPRVGLELGRLLVAFRYEQGPVSTVVTLPLECRLTETADVVAIRIRQLKAGSIPVPLAPLIENITKQAHANDIAIRWQREEGDPVALIPLRFDASVLNGKTLVLKSLVISPEGVTIAGELKGGEEKYEKEN